MQKCISLSLTEAEYVSLAEASTTITSLQRVLQELCTVRHETEEYQDNAGYIACVQCGIAKQFSQSKRVDLRYNYIMNLIEQVIISIT